MSKLDYDLFSWFDGADSTHTTVTDIVGYDQAYFIAAKTVTATGLILTDKHGFDPGPSVWRKNKHHVPSRYVEDV